MPLHIHAQAAKSDALHLQPESLLGPIFAAQLDRATRPQYPIPRQPVNLPQDGDNLPRGARPSGCARDAAVACHSTPRQ